MIKLIATIWLCEAVVIWMAPLLVKLVIWLWDCASWICGFGYHHLVTKYFAGGDFEYNVITILWTCGGGFLVGALWPAALILYGIYRLALRKEQQR